MLRSRTFFFGLLALALFSCRSEAVESWTVDPFMTDAQEQAILQWLQKPCPFAWGAGTTLQDLERDLASGVPTLLDRRAIDEIGLRPDVELVPASKLRRQSSRPATVDPFDADAASRDPFAPAADDERPFDETTVDDHSLPSNPTAGTPWWRRTDRARGASSDEATAPATASLGARLLLLLGQVDMTVSIRGGHLILTTRERAEELLCIRVYDVTALLDPQPHAPDILMQTIETAVEPDTWESLGGASTMSAFSSQQRKSLVISAPVTVHWKVHAMLERLNR